MKKPNEQIERLAALSTKINDSTDELTGLLSEFEGAVNRFAPGVYACVDLDVEEDIDHGVWLAFGKIEGRWGLLIESGRISDDEQRSTQPVCKSSRDLRIQAAGKLPELLAEIAAATERKLSELADSIETAARVLAQFEGTEQ